MVFEFEPWVEIVIFQNYLNEILYQTTVVLILPVAKCIGFSTPLSTQKTSLYTAI